MREKKILLIYPINFLDNNAGNNNYVYGITKYLKEKGFLIDFLTKEKGLNQDWSNWDIQNKEHFINNFFLYRESEKKKQSSTFERIFKTKKTTKYTKYYFCGIQLWKVRNKNSEKNTDFFSDFGYTTKDFIAYCNEVIANNQYDYVWIHYIFCAEIFKHLTQKNFKKIYSMHDSHFLQIAYENGKIVENLTKELGVFQYIDKTLCISFDEMCLYNKFFPQKKFYFLPPIVPVKELCPSKKDIDMLFCGFSNPFNVAAIKWLVFEVLPLIKLNIHLTICGKVLKQLKNDCPEIYNLLDKYSVTKIDYAEDLDALYARTKISLSPMLGGTGMKIKTIDAMARGIPVVSTILGVDGFPDKYESGILVANTASEFVSYIERLTIDEKFYQDTQNKMMNYYKKLEEFAKNAIDQTFN